MVAWSRPLAGTPVSNRERRATRSALLPILQVRPRGGSSSISHTRPCSQRILVITGSARAAPRSGWFMRRNMFSSPITIPACPCPIIRSGWERRARSPSAIHTIRATSVESALWRSGQVLLSSRTWVWIFSRNGPRKWPRSF